MPLPQATERQKLHDRTIHCQGYKREDGLWDIEAHLQDFRSYECSYHDTHRGGAIKIGEPVHDMLLRLTIDLDFMIHDAHASSDATPFPSCEQSTIVMKELIGLRIGTGWMREVRQRIAATQSCTHLMDLLAPIAATAYQTLHAELEARAKRRKIREKPKILDTCLALASDGEVVQIRWPEFYTGKQINE